MSGPFLVPFIEGTISLTKVVHFMGSIEDKVGWDEMGLKVSFKLIPSSKVNRIGIEGFIGFISSPCASWSADSEMGESGTYSVTLIWVNIGIEVVIVG